MEPGTVDLTNPNGLGAEPVRISKVFGLDILNGQPYDFQITHTKLQ